MRGVSLFLVIFLAVPVFVSADSSPIPFSPVVNLSHDPRSSKTPVIAAVGKNVYVAWIDSSSGHAETYFRASTDNGKTWGKMVAFALKGSSLNVQIAADNNFVFLAWQQTIASNPAIDFAARENNGVSFGPVQNLSGISGFPTIGEVIKASANNVYVAWVRSPQNGIYFDKSTNFGGAFAPPKLIDPVGHEEEMALGGKSNVYLTWDSIFFTRSADNGTSFSKAVQIDSICCPRNLSSEPMIAASGTNVYITWTSNSNGPYEAYVAVSHDYGTTFAVTNLSGNFLSAREL